MDATTGNTLFPRVGDPFVNVHAHGVTGDGETDDTAALQRLIDAASADKGATLLFPPGTYRAKVELKPNVTILGSQPVHGYGPTSEGSTRFRAVTGDNGWVIDVTGSRAGVKNVDVWGQHGTTHGGIRIAGHNVKLDEIHFNNFNGPAVQITTGNACTLDNILAFNCLLDRAPTGDVGVMDIGGNDHYISRVEANASLKTATSPDLRCNAWVVRGTNNFIFNCVGEFSDRGWLITGGKNRLTGVRGDRNYGPGWETRGGANAFAACMAVDNNRGTHGVHPGFLTAGYSNTYAGCLVDSLPHELPSWAFEDRVANASPFYRNTYTGCTGRGVHGAFKGDDYLGSSFDVPNHPMRAVGGSIPVDESGFVVLTGGTVDDFTRGHSGQTITVHASTASTIRNTRALRTTAGTDLAMPAGAVARFSRYNGAWFQH